MEPTSFCKTGFGGTVGMMGEVSLNMELLVPLMEVGSDELEDFVINEVCLFFTIIEF